MRRPKPRDTMAHEALTELVDGSGFAMVVNCDALCQLSIANIFLHETVRPSA